MSVFDFAITIDDVSQLLVTQGSALLKCNAIGPVEGA